MYLVVEAQLLEDDGGFDAIGSVDGVKGDIGRSRHGCGGCVSARLGTLMS